MEWVETTGRTVAEAKDKALDQLGVDEVDAEFEVLEEPKTGLFGRLRSEARVRARVRPTRPRAKEDRRDKRRRQRDGGEKAAGVGKQADGRVVVTGRALAAGASRPSETTGRTCRYRRAGRPRLPTREAP
jgi:spoIIIJ-associated protein